jgi:hypothetical protein
MFWKYLSGLEIVQAQPPLDFIPPRLNPSVLRVSQQVLPLWLKWQTPLREITADRVEILAELYHQLQQGKIRFLMAFRHPSLNDPYCLAYLLWKLVPQVARQQGIALQSPIHAHFLYDRGIPLWAGSAFSWFASRLGGTSIQRGKLDIPGLRSARTLFANSTFPMAAAPEGATNGHNEIVSPLEPGIAQLSFWCLEDLLKAQRTEEVFVVPIGIQYHYLTPPWKAIAQLLTQLETESGLPTATPTADSADAAALYQRLYRLGEHLLSLMENFYREFYYQSLPPIPEETITEQSHTNGVLATRLQNLLNVALQVAEQYFNIQANGTLVERCRRIEQAGWDCIYREELKPTHVLSAVERGLADRVAEEASLRMWHMRLVESFVAVTGYYVKEKPSAERFADTALLLWDFLARIKGKNGFSRPQLGKQRVQMAVGNPISISARRTDYQANRRQAVANLTQDLQLALEAMLTSVR